MSPSAIRLVIADDHQLVREALSRLLNSEPDLSVEAECTDGDTALAKIRELEPDVAVVDMTMPGRTGLEVAIAVQAEGPTTTRMVMLTARRAPELARRALEHGVQGIVLKEDAFDDLLYAIRAAMEGRRFVSAALAGGVLSGTLPEASPLTEREQEVLRLVSQGLTNAQIGTALEISAKTVDNHRTRIMRKLEAHSLADLIRHAIRIGLVEA